MRRKVMRSFVWLGILTSGTPAASDTIWVDTTLDTLSCHCGFLAPCCSLRAAIGYAGSSDTITFRQSLEGSVIELGSGELVINKNITIDGDVDEDRLPDITLDTSTESRIIRVTDGIVNLTGLIIQHGNPSPGYLGAGLSISSGVLLALNDSIIRYNGNWRGTWNISGGGIYNGGFLLMDNTRVTANYGHAGGGIYNESAMIITNSEISYNHAKAGGAGLFNTAGATLNISDSEISQNSIEQLVGDPDDPAGGGVYNAGTATISASTLKGNSILDESEPFSGTWPLGGFGGGLFNSEIVTIRRSLFDSNRAASGGAVMSNDRLTMENSTLYQNSADYGGGIFNSTSASSPTSEETFVVRNCTIYQNMAQAGRGAGVYLYSASGPDGEHISNSIFAGNDYVVGGDDCIIRSGAGTLETNIANLIEDGTCSPAVTGDPKLGELGDHGGATETLALLAASPAINGGANSCLSPSMTTDQRGSGYPRVRRGVVDIGAYEYFRLISFPIRSPGGKNVLISF